MHSRRHRTEVDEAELEGDERDETVFIDNLPNDEHGLKAMLKRVRNHIQELEKQFFIDENSDEDEETKNTADQIVSKKDNVKQVHCIPLSVNVSQFDFQKLIDAQLKNANGRLFDVITIDPPWQLSSANPTRGVAIAYSTLNDLEISEQLPFDKLQTDGFLFIWVINAKYRYALGLFEKYGYRMVDELVWVKQTINGKIARGHGYYLQHAKETCLIGYKGDLGSRGRLNIESDVIFS